MSATNRTIDQLARAMYGPPEIPPTNKPAPASPNKATNRTTDQLAAALYPNGGTTFKKGK